jgi:hypothetical protein
MCSRIVSGPTFLQRDMVWRGRLGFYRIVPLCLSQAPSGMRHSQCSRMRQDQTCDSARKHLKDKAWQYLMLLSLRLLAGFGLADLPCPRLPANC